MKSIMFLKTKGGEYLFKIDSFWSKSKDPDSAKIYSSSDIDQVNSWLKDGIMPWNIYKDKIDFVVDRYDGGILGYFTPVGSNYLKRGTSLDELGDPNYLWVIKLKPSSEWVIVKEDDKAERPSITPDTRSMVTFENYREYKRDKALTDVLSTNTD